MPTVTIRQQWLGPPEAFLDDESSADEMISQNPKQPMITVATYRALHSAINRLEGDAEVEGYGRCRRVTSIGFKGVGYRWAL